MTTPVVPSTLSPPTMPRRGLVVRAASASPPGIAIVTTTSAAAPYSPATSPIAAPIISRGFGLIAGSPTASGRPGNVTVPTPSPAARRIPLPGGAGSTVARTSTPCVTSGSSPASLTMPAVARAPSHSAVASAKVARWSRGRRTDTGSGKRPLTIASKAARAAAAAQAPVVQPRRSSAREPGFDLSRAVMGGDRSAFSASGESAPSRTRAFPVRAAPARSASRPPMSLRSPWVAGRRSGLEPIPCERDRL